jgi:hypothetical protein
MPYDDDLNLDFSDFDAVADDGFESFDADLSTDKLRLAFDIQEAAGAVCELRDRAHGELAAKLSVAAAALFDAFNEAERGSS